VSTLKRQRFAAHSTAVARLGQNLSLYISRNAWPARLCTHFSYSSLTPNAQASAAGADGPQTSARATAPQTTAVSPVRCKLGLDVVQEGPGCSAFAIIWEVALTTPATRPA
jgi:hypothetical protein